MSSSSTQTGPAGQDSSRRSAAPARPDALRRMVPRALVAACLAGSTLTGALAADRGIEHAAHRNPAELRTVALVGTTPWPPRRRLTATAAVPAPDPAPPAPAAVPAPAPAPATTTDATPAAAGGDAHGDAGSPPAARHHRHRHRHPHHHRAGRRPYVPLPDVRIDVPSPDVPRHARKAASGSGRGRGGLNWAGLAHCEAGGRPHAVDPTGTYGGLYQFDRRTWHAIGGQGRPQDASAAEQTYRAKRLYARRGSGPWPVCGGRLYR